MKLHEIMPTINRIISAIPELAEIKIFTDIADHKRRLEKSIHDKGLAIVIIQESGRAPDPSAPDLLLENMLLVSILENPETNKTGLSALEITGMVLKAIHQYDWYSTGLKNALTVDNPAYTRGELESGLITYFCNFLIKTIE